jgi:hypothetical protein
MSDETTYGTSGGVPLTDEMIHHLADEAAEGYDVTDKLPSGDPPRGPWQVILTSAVYVEAPTAVIATRKGRRLIAFGYADSERVIAQRVRLVPGLVEDEEDEETP